MQKTIDETNRRRTIQMQYNETHGITPQPIIKSTEQIMGQTKIADSQKQQQKAYTGPQEKSIAADPIIKYMSKQQLKNALLNSKKEMEKAVKDLNFIIAAKYRDEIKEYEKRIENF